MRRLYAPTVLGLVVLGGGAWYAARQPWVTTELGDGPAGHIVTTGADVFAPLPGLALVVLAGAFGVLATTGWVRRIVALLVVAFALAGVAGCFIDPWSAVDQKIAQSPAFGKDAVSGWTAWPAITGLLFGAAALAGMVAAVAARRWPAMSARYDAPGRAAAGVAEEPADIWKALDDGRDPTE